MIENKNILIIGGSSGIGLALAELLASNNNIYVASRSNENVKHLNVQHITFDATQEELDTSELPDHLHGFVYCPGSINLRPFKGLKLDAFQSDFEINVLGAVRSLKSVLGHLSAITAIVGPPTNPAPIQQIFEIFIIYFLISMMMIEFYHQVHR